MKPRRLRIGRTLMATAALLWACIAVWNLAKPLPDGLAVAGPFVAAPPGSLQLLTDLTFRAPDGTPVHQRQIHAATLALVREARGFLVLDYFLFNGQGGPRGPLRLENGLLPASAELIGALREVKQAQPSLPVLVLVDPINGWYTGEATPELAALRQAGIDVVVTRLDGLRDSNPVWSATWRMLAGWWMSPDAAGRWRNPLDGAGPELPLGALLRIPNFKANHRKAVLTADAAGELTGIISSGNPHDASSAHSNIALRVTGEALRPLLDSELAVARFSGWRGQLALPAAEAARDAGDPPSAGAAQPEAGNGNGADHSRVAIATEGAIHDALLARLDATTRGDAIDLAMFYLSDRHVIQALLAAAERGATIRVLLDPNKDAFGFEKSGIPNRQVAAELLQRSRGAIGLRWYRTHGEQFHVKYAGVTHADTLWFTLGSANFTRRNLEDYNLEANAIVETPAGSALAGELGAWFDRLWTNPAGGPEYSADATLYAEPGFARYWLYRWMEGTGMSTF